MSSQEAAQAPVPICVTGWRVWDLYAGRDMNAPHLTRGIHVVLDRVGNIAPESDRKVRARELSMILEVFGDGPLAFFLSMSADEGRLPEYLDKLIGRFPALRGHTFHIVNQLKPETCEGVLRVKARHELRVVLPHYTLYGADAWAPAVRLADQVQFDAGSGRGIQSLNLDGRTTDQLRLVADATRVAIGLAGRLTGEAVDEMALRLRETQAMLDRPLAFCAESQLRNDAGLDIAKCAKFHDACARVLGFSPAAAGTAAAT